MARQTAWLLAGVMTCAAPAVAAQATDQGQPKPAAAASKDRDRGRPDQQDRWKWWLYDRAELGISDQQSAAINEIFEANITKLRELRRELDDAEAALSKTVKENAAEVSVVSQQADRLESARAAYNKCRTLMLYRMQRVLSAEQLTKVEALRARRDAARRRSNDNQHRR
jgi:Spy/CpxP family protein refolding chaperone